MHLTATTTLAQLILANSKDFEYAYTLSSHPKKLSIISIHDIYLFQFIQGEK